MSGICDKCICKPCPAEGEGLRRCDLYKGGETNWERLFGTPERAARTLVNLNCDGSGCDGCSLGDIECNYGYDALLEWLRGDA